MESLMRCISWMKVEEDGVGEWQKVDLKAEEDGAGELHKVDLKAEKGGEGVEEQDKSSEEQ